jgi:hypothetical protein
MLRRRVSAATQAQRRIPIHGSALLVQQPDFPLPEIDGTTGVQEGFRGPQLELAQRPGARCPAQAIEPLAVNAEQEADVIPAEDGAEDRIKFLEKERVGHGEDADDHGTHVAENCSKNQTLEGRGYALSLRLPADMPPDPRLPGGPGHGCVHLRPCDRGAGRIGHATLDGAAGLMARGRSYEFENEKSGSDDHNEAPPPHEVGHHCITVVVLHGRGQNP